MPKRRRSFRWLKWLVFLLLVVGVVVVVILVKNSFNNSHNDEPQSIETSKIEEQTGGSRDENKETEKQEEKVPQYDGESPNKSETLTGLVSYADVIDNELVIRVSIDQFLQTGECNLKLTRNGVTYYSQSVQIVESVTTSTCDGFKIAREALPSGDLQVEIDLESQGKSGKIEGRVRI